MICITFMEIRYCIKDNNYRNICVFDFAFANVLRGTLHLAAILFSSLSISF